jgi:hypothetical protein
MEKQQICSKCNQPKEMKEFSKKASSSNGYSGVCKSCVYERQKERKNEKTEWWDEFVTPKW